MSEDANPPGTEGPTRAIPVMPRPGTTPHFVWARLCDKGSHPCEGCGHPYWELVMPESPEGPYMIPFQPPFKEVPVRYWPVAILVCKNCSNMRFFATEAIMATAGRPSDG